MPSESESESETIPPTPLTGGGPVYSKPRRERKTTGATSAPESLESEQSARLKAWRDTAFPWLSDGVLMSHAQECLDWHGGKGNRHADWVRTCQTWIRKDIDDGKITQPSKNGKADDPRVLFVQETRRKIEERLSWIDGHQNDPRVPAVRQGIAELEAKIQCAH